MNPFNYLHLPDQDIDIRGSSIALCFRYGTSGRSTSVLAVNFIDGRWPKTVQEPELRIREVLNDPDQNSLNNDPFFIHLVYLFSVTKWWTNALNSIHDQLIAYVSVRVCLKPGSRLTAISKESILQNDEEVQPADTMSHQDINRALHAMAAHLHRYTSELKSIDDTIVAVTKSHCLVMGVEDRTTNPTYDRVETGLQQITSQVKAVRDFEGELEKKIQTSLALVSSSTTRSGAFVLIEYQAI